MNARLSRQEKIFNKIDWIAVLIFFLLIAIGWVNIAASVFEEGKSIFSLDLNSGKQLVWIGFTVLIIIIIMTLDYKSYESLSYIIYGLTLILLILVILVGKEISGSKSWISFGGFGIQPSEFAKFATALAVAKYMGDNTLKLTRIKDLFTVGIFLALPVGLIMMQPDAGTSMVFSSFIIVFYREGMSPAIIAILLLAVAIFVLTLFVDQFVLISAVCVVSIIAIAVIVSIGVKTGKRIITIALGAILIVGVIWSVDYIVTDVFKPHQQARIKALINPDSDPLGYGFHVTQSKITIGSGGLWGKGFMQGTQTKLKFVPEQSTDFIFSTLGEEHGWVGSAFVIGLFIALLFRIIAIAERQKSKFVRIYGYSVASIIFFHFMVNIGMTIGLFPVVGIPLPFFSYGGSSLWAFTILLFILIKLDAHRMQLTR